MALIQILALFSFSTLTAASSFSDLSAPTNASLLWGPYRPNVYFGVRPRLPEGPSFGLLWSRLEDYESVQNNFRYTCEQNEGMAGYGWEKYEPRNGGIQVVHDAGNGLDVTTEFVKDSSAGDKGGNWAVRVKATPRNGVPKDTRATMVLAVAVPGVGGADVEGNAEVLGDEKGLEGQVVITGDTVGLGKWKVSVSEGKGKRPEHDHESYEDRPLSRTFVQSLRMPENVLWRTREILFSKLKESVDVQLAKFGQENLPPPFQFYTMKNQAGSGNVHLIQKVFQGPFAFDVIFSSAAAEKEMTTDELTAKVKSTVAEFDKKFDQVFKPKAPFASEKYLSMSKALFSNLLGGIGYFQGDWLADRSDAPEYEEEDEGFWEQTAEARSRVQPQLQPPVELYTSIPSRPFFPRGFLWDEGFHLLPVIDWDLDLTLDIVRSWFNLIDDDGWIAREQILGDEARSKVPEEFRVQYPHYANPPTLFLILTNYIDQVSSPTASATSSSSLMNKEAAKAYLTELYPLLQRHYAWFRRTQAGDLKTYEREAPSAKEGYRWRGRTPTHCLPSGLDDYPRAQPPHPAELHVDALSWVGLMAQSLRKIAAFIGETEDAARLSKQEQAIKKNIDALHWDEKAGAFCDASIDQFEEETHACHKGYISLFPFLVGLLSPTDPHVGKLLDLISDPNELWSPYGIRSLSKADPEYATAENYWRSPIWININYLIVSQLLKVSESDGPYKTRAREIYTALRKNLVDTVARSWEETGFAWEQYDPETGRGQRTQHFTGWTSLVVKIMAMPNFDVSGKDEL